MTETIWLAIIAACATGFVTLCGVAGNPSAWDRLWNTLESMHKNACDTRAEIEREKRKMLEPHE